VAILCQIILSALDRGHTAHRRDLIDSDVVSEVACQVSVASRALIMLNHDERDCAQDVCSKGQVEKHVDGGPDSFCRVGS